jgi:hypothetical protein
VAALLAARAVYAARDEALRIARAPLNFHHILGRKPFFAQVDKVFASGGKISTSGDQKKDVRTSLQRRARIAVPCTATSRECQLRHSAHPMYRAIYRLAHFWQSADPPGRLSARASALLGISF